MTASATGEIRPQSAPEAASNRLEVSPGLFNDHQQLVFAIVQYLSEPPMEPQSLDLLTEALYPATRDEIAQAIWNMQHAGWVANEGDGYRLSVVSIELPGFSERLEKRFIQALNAIAELDTELRLIRAESRLVPELAELTVRLRKPLQSAFANVNSAYDRFLAHSRGV